MLKVKNLKAGYDGVPVIFDLTFQVGAGELVSIVGSNGAGKTTILRAVSGLIRPMAGEIEFSGERVEDLIAHNLVKIGIVHVPEGRHVFGKMSITDNLLLGAYTVKSREDVEETLQEVFEIFPRLKERQRQKAETLSGGEQQMLAIARGLMSRPKLLMVDELSLGLMPILVEKVLEILQEISRRGMTILLVEQKIQEALEMADRAYILQTGRIINSGSGKELLESKEVKKAYLGM